MKVRITVKSFNVPNLTSGAGGNFNVDTCK